MGKKLLTFLGTTKYEETVYYFEDRESKSRFIQKALCNILGEDIQVVVFLTPEAKKRNWLNGYYEYAGLEQELDMAHIPYRPVDILEGKNKQEMWHNFEIIYNEIEEGDIIDVDVTHSFRSIPFIFMSVLNYARFIKNIQVNNIYYGAFQAACDNRTPIFDLSMFIKLSDWTVGAEKLLSTGDGELFSKIVKETVTPILRETKGANKSVREVRDLNEILEEYTKALKSSRGNIISRTGFELKEALFELKAIECEELRPFEKIIDQIIEKVNSYRENLLEDIHHTVCLCRDFKLIQQAYTFITENIINFVCIHGGLDLYNKKIEGKKSRESAKDILYSFYKEESIDGLRDYELNIREKLKGVVSYELAKLYDDISDYRNDLNHAGYRQDPKGYEGFVEKLNEFINKCEGTMGLRGKNN